MSSADSPLNTPELGISPSSDEIPLDSNEFWKQVQDELFELYEIFEGKEEKMEEMILARYLKSRQEDR